MKILLRICLLTGLLMLLVSALLFPFQEAASPERIITLVNLIIGALLLTAGILYPVVDGRKNKQTGTTGRE